MDWIAGLVAAVAAVGAAIGGALAWAVAATEGKVAEWATVATTALTAIGGFVGYRNRRRRQADEADPISEVEVTRTKEGLIHVALVLENRSGRSIRVTALRLRRPAGGKLSEPHPPKPPGDSSWTFESATMPVRWHVTAAGAPSNNPLRSGRGDRVYHRFAIEPPPGWAGGKVVVELTLLESAQTVRSRRLTIRRTL